MQLAGKAWVATKGKVAEEEEKQKETEKADQKKVCEYRRSRCSYSGRKELTHRSWMGRETRRHNITEIFRNGLLTVQSRC